MSIKNFLMRKLLASKLKGVPESEQEKIFNMIEKNPDLFQKIAMETQNLIKSGKSEMTASMEVMKKYESELKSLL